MGSITNLKLVSTEFRGDPLSGRDGWRLKMQRHIHQIRGLLGGSVAGDYTATRGLTRATGTLTCSSTSGTVGGVVNGVAITDTAAVSDTHTAGLIVAAINASTDALVAGFVEAGNLSGTLAISSGVAGDQVTVCGFTFKAVPAGQTPSSGLQFAVGGTDTATGDNLVAAINVYPILSDFIVATNASGTVTVCCTSAAIPSGFINNLVGSANITAGAATLAAGAVVYVTSLDRGVVGNQTTLAASGTGVTASGARLTGGTVSTSQVV